MKTATRPSVSPAEAIKILGQVIRDAVEYDGKGRDLMNLRKVWVLCHSGDPNWRKFLALWAEETPSPRCASVAVEILRVAKEKAARDAFLMTQTRQPVTEDGMYRTPTGEIFKVQFNKAQGDGRRLYAKQLLVTLVHDSGQVKTLKEIPLAATAQETDPWQVVGAEFRYVSGAVRRLDSSWRMTPEQARDFGALYGTCCVCGRTLTDEKSIEAGIGPVCAGKF